MKMKRLLFLLLAFFYFGVYGQQAELQISGVVTQNGYPVYNAGVSIMDSPQGVLTNEKGSYTIEAKPGDVLIFQHLGLKTVEVVIEDVTNILNIAMNREEEQLEEVVVEKRKIKKEFYK